MRSYDRRRGNSSEGSSNSGEIKGNVKRERSQERLRGKVSKENKRGITREIPGNIETIKKMVAAERESIRSTPLAHGPFI